ncbi:MAG TPA: DNRLRE domain-containing protein [Pirellulales bacterium]|nr:DNRLRE domain-containing protein [Pirellulales bacterium]
MKHFIGVASFAILCLMSSGMVRATTVSFIPAADNTIYSEDDNSAGQTATLFVGGDSIAPTADARRAMLEFDLSSIPAGSTITAASLTLNVTTVGGNDQTTRDISLYKLTAAWGEGTSHNTGGGGPGSGGGNGFNPTQGGSTWNYGFYNTNLWTTPGGDFVSTPSATAAIAGATGAVTFPFPVTWTSTDLIADVQSWIDAPGSNFGWLLKSASETSPKSTRQFDSREATESGAVLPTLSISYTPAPEPSTLALGAIGALLLAGWSLRRST